MWLMHLEDTKLPKEVVTLEILSLTPKIPKDTFTEDAKRKTFTAMDVVYA